MQRDPAPFDSESGLCYQDYTRFESVPGVHSDSVMNTPAQALKQNSISIQPEKRVAPTTTTHKINFLGRHPMTILFALGLPFAADFAVSLGGMMLAAYLFARATA